MIVNDYSELNEIHKDALLELGNIGTGNALTALSQLLEHPIEMNLPHIHIVEFEDLSETILGKKYDNAGVIISVSGELECVITFMLNEKFAQIVGEDLTGEEIQDIKNMNEFQKSAICEIGNIMCNSYLNAMAVMLAATMDVSVPTLKIGTADQILNEFSPYFKDKKKGLLVIENTFYYQEYEMMSHILMHPKFKSLQEILERLEV